MLSAPFGHMSVVLVPFALWINFVIWVNKPSESIKTLTMTESMSAESGQWMASYRLYVLIKEATGQSKHHYQLCLTWQQTTVLQMHRSKIRYKFKKKLQLEVLLPQCFTEYSISNCLKVSKRNLVEHCRVYVRNNVFYHIHIYGIYIYIYISTYTGKGIVHTRTDYPHGFGSGGSFGQLPLALGQNTAWWGSPWGDNRGIFFFFQSFPAPKI